MKEEVIYRYGFHLVALLSFIIAAIIHFLFVGPLAMLSITMFIGHDLNRSVIDSYVYLLKLNVKFTSFAVSMVAWFYSIWLMLRVVYKSSKEN